MKASGQALLEAHALRLVRSGVPIRDAAGQTGLSPRHVAALAAETGRPDLSSTALAELDVLLDAARNSQSAITRSVVPTILNGVDDLVDELQRVLTEERQRSSDRPARTLARLDRRLARARQVEPS